MNLKEAETQTMQHLIRAERYYAVFRAILITVSTLVILVFMGYEANKSVSSVNATNQKTRQLIRCSLPAFTPENYTNATKIINACLEANK